jgi:hypothetical protein
MQQRHQTNQHWPDQAKQALAGSFSGSPAARAGPVCSPILGARRGLAEPRPALVSGASDWSISFLQYDWSALKPVLLQYLFYGRLIMS